MPTDLTTDEMKAKVRAHFEDFVNNRKPEVIRTNVTEDFYDHDGPGGQPTDVSGDEQMMLQMYSRMPDLHLTIEELIAEGDKVVCRNQWRWTDPESGIGRPLPSVRDVSIPFDVVRAECACVRPEAAALPA